VNVESLSRAPQPNILATPPLSQSLSPSSSLSQQKDSDPDTFLPVGTRDSGGLRVSAARPGSTRAASCLEARTGWPAIVSTTGCARDHHSACTRWRKTLPLPVPVAPSTTVTHGDSASRRPPCNPDHAWGHRPTSMSFRPPVRR
jgi:hypothetical protein